MNSNRAPISIRDAALAWIGAWLIGNLLGGSVVAASGVDKPAQMEPGWLVAFTVAEWLPMVAVLWLLGRSFGVGKPTVDYGLSFRPIDLIGVPIGVATQLALVPLLYWPLQSIWPVTFSDERLERRARELWDNAAGTRMWVLIGIVVVGAPLVEELVYRGLLQGAVGRRLHQWHGWLAVVLVAVLFALVHFSAIEYPGLFLVGLVLGTCAMRTGRLGMAVLTHAAFNAAGLVVVGSS